MNGFCVILQKMVAVMAPRALATISTASGVRLGVNCCKNSMPIPNSTATSIILNLAVRIALLQRITKTK